MPGITEAGSARAIGWRLFLTCWLVFVLHFATDIVREHYLAFTLAEDFSFRADKYEGLHVDLFEMPGRGVFINNNPGVSMLAAIPYALARPAIDLVTAAELRRRAASGAAASAVYDDPRPRRVEFYRRVRARGLDVRFGLAAAVIQALFMAPLSAAAAVVMFRVWLAAGLPTATALLVALLYAFGTPIFFRTAFLNQNLLIAHLTLFGFVLLKRPGGMPAWREGTRYLLAGAAGGLAVLADYSGLIVLVALFAYGFARADATRPDGGRRTDRAWRFALGAAGPLLLLFFYQWKCFGSPWLPAQMYIAPREWVTEQGLAGVTLPRPHLLWMLLFDSRFGLFVSCPLLALAVPGTIKVWRRRAPLLDRADALFLAAGAAALVLFFSGVQYTVTEWVTGIRYLVPAVPLLFLLVVPVLAQARWRVLLLVTLVAVGQAWCMSMAREIYVLDSIARVAFTGFQLPWMNVLVKMAPQYMPSMAQGASPLPIFTAAGVLVYVLWLPAKRPWLPR
jgi:hypothetical protein